MCRRPDKYLFKINNQDALTNFFLIIRLTTNIYIKFNTGHTKKLIFIGSLGSSTTLIILWYLRFIQLFLLTQNVDQIEKKFQHIMCEHFILLNV